MNRFHQRLITHHRREPIKTDNQSSAVMQQRMKKDFKKFFDLYSNVVCRVRELL